MHLLGQKNIFSTALFFVLTARKIFVIHKSDFGLCPQFETEKIMLLVDLGLAYICLLNWLKLVVNENSCGGGGGAGRSRQSQYDSQLPSYFLFL